MIRRNLYACLSVWASAIAWASVVGLYSVGVDRECRKLRSRVSDLESRLDSLLPRLQRVEDRPVVVSQDVSIGGNDEKAPFVPRVVGVGNTRSPVRRYKYVDVEVAPGSVERRYIPLGVSTNAPL